MLLLLVWALDMLREYVEREPRFLFATSSFDGFVFLTRFINRDSRELNGASKIIGFACALQNRAFIVCKKNAGDPEVCLKQAKEVKSCVENVVATLHSKCGSEYNAYADCLISNPMQFEKCRNEQMTLRMAYSKATK